MMKSYRTTLILAAMLAGLIGWYILYEQKYRPEQKKAEDTAKQFVSIPQNDINELTITRMTNAQPDLETAPPNAAPPKFETIRLKKVGSDWTIVAPIEADADSSAVSTMISTLTSTQHERMVDEKPKDLEVYGLKEPLLTIEAKKDSNSKPETVYVGRNTPVGSGLYVKTSAGDAVYRSTHAMRTTFDRDLKSLRNKSLLNVSRFEVNEVEIKPAKGPEILLKKEGDKDKWLLAKQDYPADTTEWNKTLTAIVDLKATEFPSEKAENLAKFGLQPPAFQITLASSKAPNKIGIWLGKADGKYYAKRADKPAVYEVPKEAFEKVARPAADYRDRHLALFDRFQTQRIKIQRGKETLEFLKEPTGWTMPTEPTVKLDGTKVDKFLTDLQDAKATKLVDNAATLKNPAIVIRLFEKKDDKETETVVLNLSTVQNKESRVERPGSKVQYVLKEEDFKKLNLPRAAFLSETKAETKPDKTS